MARWTIDGHDYQVIWVSPKHLAEVYKGQLSSTIDKLTLVFVADPGVPPGRELEDAPQGDLHVTAEKARLAVGNLLKSRKLIEFLRLAKLYPFGQEPGAIGMDGGGDPRAHPNQQDKAPVKRLLQPGEFPADRIQGTDGAAAAAAIKDFQEASAKLNKGEFPDIFVIDDPHAKIGPKSPEQLAAGQAILDELQEEIDNLTPADIEAAARDLAHLPGPLNEPENTGPGSMGDPLSSGPLAATETTEQKADGDDGSTQGEPSTDPASPKA